MRKLLVAVLCIGVVSAPVAVAFAADSDGEEKRTGTEQRDSAKAKQRNAKARAKHERAKERKKDRKRKEKRERIASSGDGQTTTASPPAQGGQDSRGGASNPTLEKIAACESGGNPSAVGGGGAYRGKYQFHQGTWAERTDRQRHRAVGPLRSASLLAAGPRLARVDHGKKLFRGRGAVVAEGEFAFSVGDTIEDKA